MNCSRPTIAVRFSGINPETNKHYKPHTFHYFETPERCVDLYFRLKAAFEPQHEVMLLPCGRPDCLLCQQRIRRSWTCRCINEAQTAQGGVFLTLTCSDDSIERTFPGRSLDHRPWQLFAKRLRRSGRLISKLDGRPTDFFRYFMCGEYGEHTGRPHYHALLFGVDFPDRIFVGHSGSGMPLYTSKLLQELSFDKSGLEIFGQVSNFADISQYDCSYVCGYVDKKMSLTDPCVYVKKGIAPEYVRMSRRPGIGYDWLRKYHCDIWSFYEDELLDDCVDTGAFKFQPPRYYFEKSKITGLRPEEDFDKILAGRRSRSALTSSEPSVLLDSLKRAKDREQIKRHELNVLKAPRQL